MKMLAACEIPLQGAERGGDRRSNIVGKPMALLLLEAGAT